MNAAMSAVTTAAVGPLRANGWWSGALTTELTSVPIESAGSLPLAHAW